MHSAGSHSPFRDGFAVLRHDLAVFAAELTWRWCFGLSVLLAAAAAIIFFLDSIQLTNLDELLLASWNPALWGIALRHVFAGSLSRLLLELLVLAGGLT